MKKYWKNRWIKALNSKRYTQGQGSLKKRDDNGKVVHCCLGVLCQVAGMSSRKLKDNPDHEYKFAENKYTGTLDAAALKKFGLSKSIQSRLVSMNDSEDKTFPEIAAYIKRHL